MTRINLNISAFLTALIAASVTFGIEWHVANMVIRPFDFLLIGTFVLLMGPQLLSGRVPRLTINRLMILFFAVQTISFLNAAFLTSTTRGIVNGIQTMELLVAFYLFTTVLRTPKALHDFLNYLLVFLWMVALYTTLYHFSQGEFVRFKNLDEPKLAFGLLFLLTALKLLFSHRLRGVVPVLLTILAIALLIASGERKGWAGVLASTTGLAFLTLPRAFGGMNAAFARRMALVPVIILVPILLLSQSPYVQKQINASATFAAAIVTETPSGETQQVTISNEMRLFLIDRAFEMIAEHPVVGVGTERFEEELLGWRPHVRHNISGVHNEYLRVAAENGFPALALFTLMWLLINFDAYRVWRRSVAPNGNVFFGYVTLGYALYVTMLVALLKSGLAPDFLTLLVIIIISVQSTRPGHFHSTSVSKK